MNKDSVRHYGRTYDSHGQKDPGSGAQVRYDGTDEERREARHGDQNLVHIAKSNGRHEDHEHVFEATNFPTSYSQDENHVQELDECPIDEWNSEEEGPRQH